MHRRRTAIAILVSACALLPCRSRAGDAPIDVMTYLRAHPDEAAGSSVKVQPAGAWGKTKAAIFTEIPQTIDVPVTVPPHARFRVGIALKDRIFADSLLGKTEPTRFAVTLVRPDGRAEPIVQRTIDPRGNEHDRGWKEFDVDVSRLSGLQGTLRLRVEVAAKPDMRDTTFAVWQHPVLYDAEREATRTNLVFVTIDTLRADHLSCQGYSRATTPRLDQLAAQGVRFANAFTSAPMTLPSMAQIFTSAYLPRFGSPNLLSALYAGSALRTKAIVNNEYLSQWLTLQTRDAFDSFTEASSWRADRMVRAGLEWIDWRKGQPFALFLHLIDTHTPYRPPGDYAALYADHAYQGPVGTEFADVDGARAGKYGPADQARIVSLYDGALRFTDESLGELFDGLAQRGLLDRTLVVVSADHGEEHWDHGSFFHGQSLYDELLHVPLIMRLPGGAHAGAVVPTPVRSVDIVPTIAEILGLPTPPDFQGTSLVPVIEHPESAAPRTLFTHAANPDFPYRFGIRTLDRKLVLTVPTGREELYDLAADPTEHHDRAGDAGMRDVLAAMRDTLEHFRGGLRQSGFQIRAAAHDGASHDVRVVVSSGKGLPLEHPDRIDLAAGDQLVLRPDASKLKWKGRIGARAVGLRFDRGFNDTDLDPGVAVEVTVDGSTLPASAVYLGPKGIHPPAMPFTYQKIRQNIHASPSETQPLATATAPDPEVGDAPVTVQVWRFPDAPPTSVAPAPVDDESRRRLRALGYVQ